MVKLYMVESGKGPKGDYRRRYSLASEAQAWLYYTGINIGNGYKKRLRLLERDLETGESKITLLARAFS